MYIVQEMMQATQAVHVQRAGDAQLADMLRFYREKCQEGAVIKHEYNLPLVNNAPLASGVAPNNHEEAIEP